MELWLKLSMLWPLFRSIPLYFYWRGIFSVRRQYLDPAEARNISNSQTLGDANLPVKIDDDQGQYVLGKPRQIRHFQFYPFSRQT